MIALGLLGYVCGVIVAVFLLAVLVGHWLHENAKRYPKVGDRS